MKKNLLTFTILIIGFVSCTQNKRKSEYSLASISLKIDSTESRVFSYTNKLSGYWVDFTGAADHPEWAWFEGWTVSRFKISSGYDLFINEQILNEYTIEHALVRPDYAKKTYKDGSLETLWMYDYANVISVDLVSPSLQKEDTVSLAFKDPSMKVLKVDSSVVYLSTVDHNAGILAIGSSSEDQRLLHHNGRIAQIASNTNRFYLSYSPSPDEALDQINQARANSSTWQKNRSERMQRYLSDHIDISSDNPRFDNAIHWIALNLDQLLTQQQGTGIYAGLPWFNDYWGRDLFISMPGATLVTGKFQSAKNILLSFAALQDTIPSSATYGRIPNRARPDDLIYNTVDGTPRFVIQAFEYLNYTADFDVIPDLYPSIKRSIEGSLARTDEDGFITHDDADTWMDAKIDGTIPWSPRGNRANDIQALWVQQLEAAAWFAEYMGEQTNADRWITIANKLKERFNERFILKDLHYIADHIDENDQIDTQFRPNQLFTFELLNDEQLKAQIIKDSWNLLVYPWGVSSLAYNDPNFHPYHLAPEYYHKDSAYHNGAIWLWLNGIAMQRLIEFGQHEEAFKLFQNMNEIALTREGVGGLPENSDAYPRQEGLNAKITGTFLQAWSNAEHLRIWYDSFIGFKPNMINGSVQFAPRIPEKIKQLSTKLHLSSAFLSLDYKNVNSTKSYQITNHTSQTITFRFHLENYEVVELNVEPQHTIEIEQKSANTSWIVKDENALPINSFINVQSDSKKSASKRWEAFFRDIRFAKPDFKKTYKSLEQLK